MAVKDSRATVDVPSGSGGYVVREMVRFVFFVRQAHRDIAPSIVEVASEIIDLFPPPALAMFAGESGDWFEYDAEGLKSQVGKRLVGKDKPINGSFSISGNQANIPDYLLEYTGLAMDLPLFGKSAAVLSLSVSPAVFEEHYEILMRATERFSTRLGCSFAYIDVALDGHRPRIQAMARRYRAFDISDVRCVARDLDDKIPGVFWYNLLGAKLTKTLGGAKTLRTVLSDAALVEKTDTGGLVVKIGAVPTSGDVNRREDIADRLALARLAHEHGLLHVPKKVTYFDAEDDLSDEDAQQRWHLRYVG